MPVLGGAQHTISIHAPREGSDSITLNSRQKSVKFQSTLPARGATALGKIRGTQDKFQSTLPARGATMDATSTM